MEGRKPLDVPRDTRARDTQARDTQERGVYDEAPRPLEVEGPDGERLTLASLPPLDTERWVARRKAEVLAAIRGGLLTAAEACARWRLSPEELELWQQALARAGVPGLRVTRIQIYRDLERRLDRPGRQQGHSNDLWENLRGHGNEPY